MSNVEERLLNQIEMLEAENEYLRARLAEAEALLRDGQFLLGNDPACDDHHRRVKAFLAADSAEAAAAPWDESKCTCVYATSANTESVRKGFEMGGYVKEQCDYCKAHASDQPEDAGK